MVEYHNNIFCIQSNWLFGEGEIMSEEAYNHIAKRKQVNIVRRGCRNTPALVEYDSLPSRFKLLVEQKVGNPRRLIEKSDVEQHIAVDSEAVSFYSRWELDNGKNLNRDVQVEYYWNAVVLNAVRKVVNTRKALHKALNNRPGGMWESISNSVNDINRTNIPHTLPANPRRLQDKYNQYIKEGYSALIHRNFCNANSRKVDTRLEKLILSIYCMGNKPYSSWVHEDYMRFIAGVLDIVDMESGELYDRADFFDDKKGTYISISEATCWNYINKPSNAAIVARLRSGNHRYLSTVRPHYHRHAPKYSLSKISLDDRDLPRKLHDGNRVKAYYAYDVASGCLIGASYSLRKDRDLFIDCVRNMFRFIDSRGWGLPLELEVEHHLVREFDNNLMKAGLVFPFVRWCAPGNSQEKHAEQLNRQKKYGYEKRYQDGIGRWYSKDSSNQVDGDRIFDDTTQKYVVKERTYDYARLVAEDLETIEAYNNGLHRNQKDYPGMTRMQVLVKLLNPNLADINKALLARYIGEKTTTSIQRNMYCQVQYNDYMLPSPEVLSNLAPNNYTVNAYYLPGETIKEVYLYQNEQFIACAQQIETFNTSIAERTDADTLAMTSQAKYIAQFDAMVKRGKGTISKVQFLGSISHLESIEPELVPVLVSNDNDSFDDYNYNPDYHTKMAIDNL